ncbi:hypothetical protein CO181_03400 [candidate division WWE3 bacterium CG_4_9_14_3_um_filter_43_9]|uniref:RDD domain-containing protein n=1 Tax=candidate division WWE3 bacterium CG_4_9_14_3_um_filter_43_9 TaxID=1975082 RepID=A0A2M7WWR3_UNCKA|nr:MAG: hypothetical protein CO181_03400 [candidate division WWE3 bacterium CG_4_9_14_3_um_filter_43_9]
MELFGYKRWVFMEESKPGYAGYLIRLAAYVTDVLIFNLVFLFLAWVFISLYLKDLGLLLKSLGSLFLFIFLFNRILWHIYLIFLTTHLGGSLGKRLFGLRVTTLEGRNLSLVQSAFRFIIGYFVSGVLLGLGYLAIFKNPQKQGWHDQVSDTLVIQEKKQGLILGLISLTVFLSVSVGLFYFSIVRLAESQTFMIQVQNEIEKMQTVVQNLQTKTSTDDLHFYRSDLV